MAERFMTADEISEEFGLTTEAIPVSGCRRENGTSVLLYRESHVIKPEVTD